MHACAANLYLCAVTVISTWALAAASLVTPTVVRAGRGALKTLPYTAFSLGRGPYR